MKKIILIGITFIALNVTAQNVGIGTTTPQSKLSVGSTSQFQVDSIGNIKKINNVPTSFPTTQGGNGQVLSNDGNGTLTWSAYPNSDYAYFSEESAAGVSVNSNYTVTANTWINRHLNTTRFYNGTSILKVGDSILLQAGTYRIRGAACVTYSGSGSVYSKSRFRNVTDNVTAIVGDLNYFTLNTSCFNGYVNITSAKYFVIQSITSTTTNLNFGSITNTSFGENELHSYIMIERIK